MKNNNPALILIFFCLSLVTPINFAAETTTYTTPIQFMNLYFDFTGSGEVDFPKNKLTIGDYLIQSEKAKNQNTPYNGPLVMFLDSSIYIYDQNRKLLYSKLLRTNRSSGFFEMTAVSHIGPALSYLAKIKENGDPSWKPAMAGLLEDIKQVRTLNAQTTDNWLDKANIKSWQPHKQQIQAMIDYAMSMSGNYIVSVQNGAPFDLNSLQQNFLNGNKDYPIPYNSVMIATFMLTAIQSMTEVHDGLVNLHLDWPHAMVIVRNVAGSNVSSGLTTGTNWMVPFVNALSNNQIPADRILIAPYAQIKDDTGEDPLPVASYQYYTEAVWGSIYNRSKIAQSVFTQLETIYMPGRPAIPGDYNYSKASDITDFMVRLKYSLLDPREMLSNTVGFWMAGEMQNKNWDSSKIEIPGLTTGFPTGITEYPKQNPDISNQAKAAVLNQDINWHL
ncbi:DUF5624 domain-containing protein [Legionella bononiensis]|uniref:DUF5624 domain-containing protein n=1 Tax=Legionella bononiensis TaxID=2793102 RepID=A0ABS1WBM1_9GAMM|nr:DUF5624 domain-containing protein [Legionella bononiensis]MBL7481037.1 DUF5624 domain-containing protein [Legionella bononiensis]MBL7526745.1 DUF5624 domain-containing protein [Legionella bononiensis]MBL7564152.1 DUF5624 domain-containing protein [Legionella bononiensis]